MGERFGKYELQRRIGVGGMAEVFVAETHGAEGFHKPVVIKRILPAFNQDPDFIRMFINEAHLAARLRHANIVQIFDFDHVDDTYYIAMEWVDGADLRRVRAVSERRKRPIPQRLAVHVGVETLKGLHYAHTLAERGQPLGFVHRDISPHNLLVSFAGEVKVADFGIAKAAALASATRTGVVKGKLPYMAPEQISAEAVDQRSDIFSVGLVLWELLRGERPHWDVESEGELLEAVRRGAVPSLAGFGEVSEDLAAVVDRMTARQPGARFQNAAEALEQLGRLATVDDGLALAAYLRQLMPAEGERQQRGATAVVAQEPFEEATAGAETRTRPSTADLREDLEQHDALAARPVVAADSTGSYRDGPAGFEGGGEWRSSPSEPSSLSALVASERPSRAPTVVLLAALALLGVGLGWLVAGQSGDETTAKVTPMAKLSIGTDPPGAKLWVDGVALRGVSPQVVEARPGQRLSVRARRRAREASTEVLVNAPSAAVSLHLKEPAAPGPVAVSSPKQQNKSSARETKPSVRLAGPSPRISKAKPLAKSPKRRRKVVPPRVTSEKAEQRFGKLHVVVTPWAFVRLNGQRLGSTPLRALRLKAGSHRLELTNPELGRRERLKVRVVGGRPTTIRRNWSK